MNVGVWTSLQDPTFSSFCLDGNLLNIQVLNHTVHAGCTVFCFHHQCIKVPFLRPRQHVLSALLHSSRLEECKVYGSLTCVSLGINDVAHISLHL